MMDKSDINFFLHLGYFPGYEEKISLDYSRIPFGRYDDWNDGALLKAAQEVFENTIAEAFDNKRKHVVPISGGLDSRAILGALLECTEASNIETYTFGTPGTYDYDLGCRVAEWAGTQHQAIALDSYDWRIEDFYEAAKRFDYQTFLFHHAPIRELEQYKDHVTWSGYIGDAVTGGHIKPSPAQNFYEAKERYLSKRCESRSVCLTDGNLAEFKEPVCHGTLTWDEALLFQEVGNITAPHVLLDGFDYQTPFINSPIWDFYMAIPTHQRIGQSLFIRAMQTAYPVLFDIPTKHAYGLRLSSSSVVQNIRRTRNKLWNIGRQSFKGFDWPALPMTNFFDIDRMLRKNTDLANFVHCELQDLKDRGIVEWIDIDDIWARHISKKAYRGDVIKLLFSLEVNCKGRDGKL
jgi:hypothetical protein